MDSFIPDSPLAAFAQASPNHGDRKGRAPDCIVLHYTGMPTADGALAQLCNPKAEVSSHYFVFEDGQIAQLVPEARRAWHASGDGTAGAVLIAAGVAIARHGLVDAFLAFTSTYVVFALAAGLAAAAADHGFVSHAHRV